MSRSMFPIRRSRGHQHEPGGAQRLENLHGSERRLPSGEFHWLIEFGVHD